MHRLLPAKVALVAAALVAAAPARALSTAATTLSDLRIVVFDLDPADGIAPTVTLDPLSRSTAVAGVVSTGGDTYWIERGGSAFGAVTAGGDLDGAGGSASFAGDPLDGGATVVTTGTGGPSSAIGVADAYVDTPGTGMTSFVLSAHTQVILVGDAAITWDASNAGASAFGEADLALSLAVPGDGQGSSRRTT